MTITISGASFLITGGASLVGSHLADALLAAGAQEVRLLDNFAFGHPESLRYLQDNPKAKVIRGDVQKLEDMVAASAGVAGIFPLAAFVTLPMSRNPALGVSVNVMGMVNTMEAARINAVQRVVFSSSVGTYGNATTSPITEETPFTSAGQNPAYILYASSKLLAEGLCEQYFKSHGIQFNALRLASVYGARQSDRAVNANFIAETYNRVTQGKPPIIVGDGREVHDYIYASDAADACVAAMASESHGQRMNIATGVDTTHTRVVEIILDACDAKHLAPEYREDTRPVKSSATARLNFSRARAEHEIGWTPKVSVEDGIRRYVMWRRSNIT